MALSKDRRKPGEIVTRRQAIRNFCYECMGYQIAECHKCTDRECWFFPYRPGATKAEFEAERAAAGLTPIKRKVRVKREKKNRKEEATKQESPIEEANLCK